MFDFLEDAVDFIKDYFEEIFLGIVCLCCVLSLFLNYKTISHKQSELKYYEMNNQIADAVGDTFDVVYDINYPNERALEIINKSDMSAVYPFVSDISNTNDINNAYNFARCADDEIGITEEAYAKMMLANLSSEPLGTYGRIAIPDIGLNLPVFNNDIDLLSKMITERITGLVAYPSGKQILLNDIFESNIKSLNRVTEGKTNLLYVDSSKNIFKYQCTTKTTGSIINGELFDAEGTNVGILNRDGFVMYSQNQNGTATITLWTLINNE